MARYRKILFICHANTSRSIMAEAMLRKMLEERALAEHLTVKSGGIAAYARNGALVSMDTRLVLRDEGIHISPEHVSTDLKRNRHMIEEADLILAMTRQQVEQLRAAFPEAAGKEIHTLKDFAGMPGDIIDPVGQDPEFFAARLDEIKTCLEAAFERLTS